MRVYRASARLSSLVTGVLCLTAALAVLGFMTGCSSEEERDRGYREGRRVGEADGRREGYKVAWSEAFEKTEPEAYDRQLQQLIADGSFRYHRGFLLMAAAGGLLSGFALQYSLFLFLRRQFILVDVDQILLGRSAASDLRHRTTEEIIESTASRLNEVFAPVEEGEPNERV